MSALSPIGRWLRAWSGVLALCLASAGALSLLFYAAYGASPSGRPVLDATIAATVKDLGGIAGGVVVDMRGRGIGSALVSISTHNSEGQLVWRVYRQADADGVFVVRASDLAEVQGLQAGTVSAEAAGYLAKAISVTLQIPAAGSEPQAAPSIRPPLIRVPLEPYNPWLTAILLIPGIFGLLYALLHLTEYSRGFAITGYYAFGTILLWSAVAAELTILYVVGGYGLIPLFWPDLFVSSGVVIFAFLGTVVYVAYRMHQERPGFYFQAGQGERRHILMTIAGRVLVAPYVAVVALGILGPTFPTLRSSPVAAFFAFFTGLWIKVVLEALNDIGTRFLGPEAAQKAAERMRRADAPEAPPPPTASARDLRPEAAFLAAVENARRDLVPKEGVLGVEAGFKTSRAEGATGKRAIVVYVYEKRELPTDHPDHIPTIYNGFPTDVVPLPAADPKEPCRKSVFQLSWEKLGADNRKRLGALDALPKAPPVERRGNVLVVADPTLFVAVNDHQEFDAQRCFQMVRAQIRDEFDCVAFVMDRASGIGFLGNYSIPVFNDIRGLGHYRGDSFSVRASWQTTRLRACQIHGGDTIDPWVLLHELGHTWCAYAKFRDPGSPPGDAASTELLLGSSDQGLLHWGDAFDDGRSCMDYDQHEWVANGDGTFTWIPLGDDDFVYCPLDLYLMGLLPPAEVGPIRILRKLERIDPTRRIYRANVHAIAIEQVIAACGPRVPASTPTTISQAFVVVSNTLESGRTLADTLDSLRIRHVDAFHRATGGRATLVTEIA